MKKISAGAEKAGSQVVPPVPTTTVSSYSKMGLSITQLAAGFAAAQIAVQGVMAAIGKVSGALEGIVEVNSQMEQLKLQFEVMIGDKDKMAELFAITKKFADTTPFNDLDSYRAGQQLLTANVKEAREYEKALRTVGDLAAASGRPISEAAGAYGRLKSGATGEAMEALRLMNISRQDFQMQGIRFDSGGQALATTKELMDALDSIVQSKFGGLTQKAGEKWTGLWSTFQSNAQNAIRTVTGGAFGQLESSVGSANKKLEELLSDKDGKMAKLATSVESLASAFGSLTKSMAPISDSGAISLLSKGIDSLSNGMLLFANTSRTAAAAAGLFWDSLFDRDNAIANFKAAMAEIDSDIAAQAKRSDKIWGVSDKLKSIGIKVSETSQPNETTEAQKQAQALIAQGKAVNDEHAKVLQTLEQVKRDTGNVTKAKEAEWAVDKAKGKDSVQLAQAEMEQRKKNLDSLSEAEAKHQSMLESNNKKYEKSTELLEAEVKYAQALAAYYDALIEKKEKLGGFITQTAKLQAEADAIDKRGGDSGVKRYEALKSSVEEYLDNLKKLRDSQQQTTAGVAKMTAAAEAAKAGNRSQLETVTNVIEQGEQIFNIRSLQERLSQIQQLSQAQSLGARERFSLYEQERQVFAELTGSIGKAIADTMSKIEALQGKALGSASSAVGALNTIGADKRSYQEVADAISEMNLDKSKMSLANLSQMASLAKDLEGKDVNTRSLMPSAGDIIGAFKREIQGVPDTIAKLQDGLQSLVGISEQIGKLASDKFFAPWEAKLAELKRAFASLSGGKPGGEAPTGKQVAAKTPTPQAAGMYDPEHGRQGPAGQTVEEKIARLVATQKNVLSSQVAAIKTAEASQGKSGAGSSESQAEADSFRARAAGDKGSIERIAAIMEKISITWPKGWTEEMKTEWGRLQGYEKYDRQPYNDPSKTPFWRADAHASMYDTETAKAARDFAAKAAAAEAQAKVAAIIAGSTKEPITQVPKSPKDEADAFRARAAGNSESIEKVAAIIEKIGISWPKGWTEDQKNEWGRQQGLPKYQMEPYNDPNKTPFWKAQIPESMPPIPQSGAARAENQATNVNAKTEINIQGSTLAEVDAIVAKAKEKFGDELYQALANAKAAYGL